MRRTVGILVMEHIAVGLVEGDKLVGRLNIFPEKSQAQDPLQSMPAESIVDCVRQHPLVSGFLELSRNLVPESVPASSTIPPPTGFEDSFFAVFGLSGTSD